jgi:hypothetical protein
MAGGREICVFTYRVAGKVHVKGLDERIFVWPTSGKETLLKVFGL